MQGEGLIGLIRTALLAAHIAAGSVALLTALIAICVEKGGVIHVRTGRAYAIAMTVVFVTSLPLALLGASVFLLLIAVFSFYLVFAGWRFARNYRGVPGAVDWAAVAVMGLIGLGMWAYAAILARQGDSQWVTMVIFGGIAVALALADVRYHRAGRAQRVKRISRHLTNMIAGTIATITAVLVVNVDTNPAWIAWVLPTIAITPLIAWWNIRVRRQNRRRPAGT